MNTIKFLPEDARQKFASDIINGIPQLLKEIVPNGYQESTYYFLQHFTAETEYLSSETDISFQEFKTQHKFPIVDPVEELAELLISVLIDINFNGFYVEIMTGCRYQTSSIEERLSQIEEDGEDCFGIECSTTAESFLLGYNGGPDSTEIDYPLFMYIFKILKLNGFEWAYYNPALVAETKSAFEDDYDESRAEGDPYDVFINDVLNSAEELPPRIDEQGDEMICIEEVFDNINKEVPPNIMVAYFDVYQKWPEGYPPNIDDYK